MSSQQTWLTQEAADRLAAELASLEGEGRKDEATARLSGRARDNRLVHFTPGDEVPRPGDVVVAEVTYAAPHHVVSDVPITGVRRTRSGDAWQARASGETERTHGQSSGAPVLLGLPTIRG